MTKTEQLYEKLKLAWYEARLSGDPDKAYVSYYQLCLISPAYSQRFGEWNEVFKDLIISKQDGPGKAYALAYDPAAIDVRRLIVKVPDMPIPTRKVSVSRKPTGAAQEKLF